MVCRLLWTGIYLCSFVIMAVMASAVACFVIYGLEWWLGDRMAARVVLGAILLCFGYILVFLCYQRAKERCTKRARE